MKLEFGRVEILNFMSFKDEVFDFSSRPGMNLICGRNNDLPGSKNGSGKSVLVQTLLFALFGQTLNNLRNENIPNRYATNKEKTSVKLWFKVDGVPYVIETCLLAKNKYKTQQCCLFKYDENGNELELTKSSIRETRKFIEKEILHCDISIFLRTIILTSDQTYNFFKLSASQKKEFIEHIFDLSVFGEMYKLIHRDNLALDKEIYAVNRELLTLNNVYHEYEEQYKNYVVSKKNECKLMTDEIKEILSKLKEMDEDHPNIEKKTSTLNECKGKCQTIITQHEKNLSECRKKLQILDREKHRLISIMNEKKTIIDKHADMLSKLCEKCSPVFDQHYSISDARKRVELIETKCAEIANAEEALTARQKEIEQNIADYVEALNKIIEKTTDIESALTTTKVTKERAKYKIKMLKEQVESKIKESNPYEILMRNAADTLKTAQNDLTEKLEKMKYIKYAELVVSQDTIRKFIIKDLINLLNSQIKIYLNKIGAKFTCEFDDQMSYTFITESGDAEYDNFSSGEKMRLSIATSFAFRDFMATRSNIISNVLILDEYIDSNLDSLAINELVKILREFIVRYNQSVYIVSHRKEINNDIFNNIIIVEKTNGISQVLYEEDSIESDMQPAE